jgi:hypothetical protein
VEDVSITVLAVMVSVSNTIPAELSGGLGDWAEEATTESSDGREDWNEEAVTELSGESEDWKEEDIEFSSDGEAAIVDSSDRNGGAGTELSGGKDCEGAAAELSGEGSDCVEEAATELSCGSEDCGEGDIERSVAKEDVVVSSPVWEAEAVDFSTAEEDVIGDPPDWEAERTLLLPEVLVLWVLLGPVDKDNGLIVS